MADHKKYHTYADYEMHGIGAIFNPPVGEGMKTPAPLPSPEVSGMLSALKGAIRLQMALRDHWLVRQSPGFFLYRPTYDENDFSHGVNSEIVSYKRLNKPEHDYLAGSYNRRIAFVYDIVDVAGYFAPKEIDGKNVFQSSIETITNAILECIRDLATTQNTDPPSGTSNNLQPEVSKILQTENWKAETIRALFNYCVQAQPGSSISVGNPLQFSQAAKEVIIRELLNGRQKALCVNTSEKIKFTSTHKKDDISQSTPDIPGALVCFATPLSQASIQRTRAAKLVGDFFKSGVC
jgi:hypothetical protein